MLHTLAYVSFQELATRISHRNTGRYTERPGVRAAARPHRAGREPAHGLLPEPARRRRSSSLPTRRCARSSTSSAHSRCPATTIEGFTRRSAQIAMAGIYDLRHHRDDVLAPILRSWDVWDRVGLSGEGEQAREQLGSYFEELDRQAGRFEERRAARQARAEAKQVKPR